MRESVLLNISAERIDAPTLNLTHHAQHGTAHLRISSSCRTHLTQPSACGIHCSIHVVCRAIPRHVAVSWWILARGSSDCCIEPLHAITTPLTKHLQTNASPGTSQVKHAYKTAYSDLQPASKKIIPIARHSSIDSEFAYDYIDEYIVTDCAVRLLGTHMLDVCLSRPLPAIHYALYSPLWSTV